MANIDFLKVGSNKCDHLMKYEKLTKKFYERKKVVYNFMLMTQLKLYIYTHAKCLPLIFLLSKLVLPHSKFYQILLDTLLFSCYIIKFIFLAKIHTNQ